MATSEGIPSSIDIEFLELNDNPYFKIQSQSIRYFFKLKGNVYAFDSTTIPLCLSIFWWAKFRKKKGGVKAHVLYDLETQVPAFFHISTASVYDSKAMKEIP